MGDFVFYGDESSGNEVDAYAVAGYVASVEQWEDFIKDWKAFSKDEGFTVLHKRLLEHNAQGSEFEWPELSSDEKAGKKKRINSRACEIILSHALAGIGVVVQKSEWRRFVSKHESDYVHILGKGFYAAGVFGCVNLVSAALEDRRRVGMVRYIFEKGPGQGEAEQILNRLKANSYEREKYRLSDYSFEKKKDPRFIPLQAADFIAYESYRQIDNQVLGGGVKLDSKGRLIKPRGALRSLVRADDPKYGNVNPVDLPVPHYGVWLDRAKIVHLLKGIDALSGAWSNEEINKNQVDS